MKLNFNLRDLEYFVAVAEQRHFGKASSTVKVSQPTLSMQLRKFEDRLGGKLIERLRGDARLTSLGEALLPRAREILKLASELESHAGSKEPRNHLRLGIIPTISPYLLPRIARGLRQGLRGGRISLHEGYTVDLARAVREGGLDAALLSTPIKEKGIAEVEIYSETFYLAVPRSHALAKRKSVQLKDLEGEKLLLLGEGHCLRNQALSICKFPQAEDDADLSATSIETLRSMVAMEGGVTLIPKLAMRKGDRIAYIPFSEGSARRSIGIIHRQSVERSPSLELLTEVIREAARKEGLPLL